MFPGRPIKRLCGFWLVSWSVFGYDYGVGSAVNDGAVGVVSKRGRLPYSYATVDSVMFCGAGARSRSRQAKRELATLAGSSNAWFNSGVATGLEFFGSGEDIPKPQGKAGAFTVLTQLRKNGEIPAGPVSLQRPAFAAGVNAVKAFAKARSKRECSVVRSQAEWGSALESALMLLCDETLAAERKTFRRFRRAEERLADHVEKGERRLFRRKKALRSAALAPIIVHEDCRLADGNLILPGTAAGSGMSIPVVEPAWDVWTAEGFEWTGGVQLIDMTDTVGRVTRRTEPEHRKWLIRWSLRELVTPAPTPTDSDRVRGIDQGIASQAVTDSGDVYDIEHDRYYTRQQEHETRRISHLSRQRSRHKNGSRRHKQLTRRINAGQSKRNRRKRNEEHHLAQALTCDPCGVPLQGIAMENLQHRSLRATAKGTVDAPGDNVAAKRGTNRGWDRRAPGRMRALIERRCERHRIAFAAVDPKNTSQVCSGCNTKGDRESQAVFVCSTCGTSHADANAGCNICNRALGQWDTNMVLDRKRAAGIVVLRRQPHRVQPNAANGDKHRPAPPHSPAASQTTRHRTVPRATQTNRTRTLV